MHKKGNLFFPAGFAVLPSGYNAEGEMHAHLQKGMRTIEQGSLHAGMPVHAGEKWIATKWLRERRFD